MRVFAFEVTVKGAPWGPTVVHAVSRGRAKSDYLRHVRDPYPDMPYTLLRCRRVGGPVTSADFIRMATARGLPHVRCGDPVTVDGDRGVIVGHNSAANFEVLFETGPYVGRTVPVHPGDCRFEATS